MKKKDALFQLIKSLSKSEKRFFKIYSMRHVIGSTNNYVVLFDALDKQLVYDEAALIRKFSDKRFVKRFAVAKSYLYELILRSMNACHAQRSTEAQLREWLGQTSFLYEKGLYEQAADVASRAAKLAAEREKLPFLLALSDWQKKIIEAQFYTEHQEQDLKDLHIETRQALEKLQNINDYWVLQAQLYYHHNQKGAVREPGDLDSIAEIFNASLLRDEQSALCFESKVLLYKIYSTYFFMVRDFTNCYNYGKKLVALLEKHPDQPASDALTYINAIHNLLNMTNLLGKEGERTHYLAQLKRMTEDPDLNRSESVRIKLFEAYYYHTMTLCLSQNRFEEGLHYVQEMERGMKIYNEHLDKMGYMMLCFYSFQICFGADKFDDAYRWLQGILKEENRPLRQDVFDFSKILSLLALYETGNLSLLRKQFWVVYRFLYQKEKQYAFDTLALDFLRQSARALPSAMPDLFSVYCEHLSVLANDTFERKVFAYFDFLKWSYAKSVGISMGELMRRTVEVEV